MSIRQKAGQVDKSEIKLLLQAYRGEVDRDDPLFAAALEEVARDPELAAWFQQEQQFDAVMVKKFAEVPVDTSLRDQILSATRNAVEAAQKQRE